MNNYEYLCVINICTLLILLQSISDESILKHIETGKINGKYSTQLRSFALTLNFYSPKAYNYVRKVFKNKLPAPSTIRSWYSNTNGAPGFSQDAIDILKKKREAAPDKHLFACLSMDEMALRTQVEWDHSQERFVGYVDYGTVFENSDNLPLAKGALVYLVTGMNQRWKIPVAYFFMANLTTKELAEITTKVLEFISTSKVHVVALTFDGLPANIAMCSHLNADVYQKKPYFKHPIDEYNVYIILDAAHMLKLIRNALASKKILFDRDGNSIKWEFFEMLLEIQKDSFCHLANKLNRKHIEWFKNKMNVKLAAQTLSDSCAHTFEQLLEDGVPEFAESASTAKFCRMVNNTFDCLNSRSIFANAYKKPLSRDTAESTFQFFTDSIDYFSSIKIEMSGKPIIETKLKTGFLGFVINMSNLKNLYRDYVETGYLRYILSYKLSQDHLEILFSCFRAMGGYNNNPNCVQFSASYKRLLHHNEITSSAMANCIVLDDTSILTVSSRKKLSNPLEKINTETNEIDEGYDIDDIPLHVINSVSAHTAEYVAGFVEKRILEKIKCNICCQLLNECNEVLSSFIKRKSFGFLRYPRMDTLTIITAAEKVFNFFRLQNKLKIKDVMQKMIVSALRYINMSKIFINFDSHVKDMDYMENHKYLMIKLILNFFFKIKLYYFGKQLTLDEHKTFVRHTLTKTVIFSGQ